MKQLLLIAGVAVLTATSTVAQGTLYFSNRYVRADGWLTVNAPIFDIDASTKLSGDRYQALLEWAPLGSSDFRPAGPPVGFLTGELTGYFDGGVVTIDGAKPGSVIKYRILAWDTAFDLFGPPVPLFSLHSFSLNQIIPEPSTNALAVCAAAVAGVAWSLRRPRGQD